MTDELWIVVRQFPHEMAEPLAILEDRAEAAALASELGEGHFVTPCRFTPTTARPTVVHTWTCRAAVAEGAVKAVGDPEQLLGATQLLAPTDLFPPERVIVDQAAAELEVAVLGTAVVYLTAHAATPQRAAKLAAEAAETLAAKQRGESV